MTDDRTGTHVDLRAGHRSQMAVRVFQGEPALAPGDKLDLQLTTAAIEWAALASDPERAPLTGRDPRERHHGFRIVDDDSAVSDIMSDQGFQNRGPLPRRAGPDVVGR